MSRLFLIPSDSSESSWSIFRYFYWYLWTFASRQIFEDFDVAANVSRVRFLECAECANLDISHLDAQN